MPDGLVFNLTVQFSEQFMLLLILRKREFQGKELP